MGDLLERVKLSRLVYGNGEAENFKNNSLFFYESYKSSSAEVMPVPVGKIEIGSFFFLHYRDDSNWMKYSPVFTVSNKSFGNLNILLAINFNFIPADVRVTIFDKYITERDFEKDVPLAVDYMGVYRELMRWGFEYALVEYNLGQVVLAHRISLPLVPRFLNSQHPVNKYDPEKLFSIWRAKLGDRAKRHEEMSSATLKDLYQIEGEISQEFDKLRGHIQRLQRSYEKYGR